MTRTDPADPRVLPDLALDFAQGEFPFTESDFAHIAQTMAAACGIVLDAGKMPLVYSRLTKRLRALGVRTFRRYCALIASEAGAGERQLMIEALTTNVTRFFREKHHFEHLRENVLPALIDEARRGGRVRLWSAGCSSGEEPYSIGLTILDMMPDAARFDIRILATDIDTQVLAYGRAGLYPRAAVAAVDPALRDRWMRLRPDADGGPGWEVGDELRSLVAFRSANLIDEAWPMRGPFQAIFCRNVVIYFDAQARRRVLTRLVSLLSRDGCLYIGHAERLPPGALDLSFVGLTTYRRSVQESVRPDRTYKEHG